MADREVYRDKVKDPFPVKKNDMDLRKHTIVNEGEGNPFVSNKDDFVETIGEKALRIFLAVLKIAIIPVLFIVGLLVITN